ncbi:MAG: FAD-dependent tricarballylate dehydrogenase TcuA [Streptosporangiales bacterium]
MQTSLPGQAAETYAADVVVVGAGNAALTAALAARESGASVLVLEAATEELRGGNSRFSGAIFRIAHDGLDDLLPLVTEESRSWRDRVRVGPYSRERYLSDLDTVTGGQYDRELTDRVIDESYDTVRWMHGHGVAWELTVGKLIDPDKIGPDEVYELPAGGAFRAEDEGVGLMANLFAAAERAGVEVWYDAPVVDLLMDGSTCTGVLVRRPDGDVRVNGVVVLAGGGFEANPELRQRWLGPGWDMVKVRGTRYNQGAPLTAAMRAGGQAYGHWGGCHAVPIDNAAPAVGDLRMTDKYSRYSYPYAVMVNSAGQRFVDEGEDEVWLTYAKTGSAVRSQPGGWAVQIFDQKTVHLLEPRYSTGVPVEADSLDGLAGKLGLDPVALQSTVDTFNAACPGGEFTAFGKDGLTARPDGQPVKSNWAQRIDEPPFVAYTVACGITFTFGGLRIDTDARVLDITERPMPSLYATGELTGGFFYHNYPAGSGLVRGAVFGRIAGRNAATAACQ